MDININDQSNIEDLSKFVSYRYQAMDLLS